MPWKVFGVEKPEWGTKRTCDKCGARFYDLNRKPAACPQCGTQQANKPSAKASAAAKAPPPKARAPEPRARDDAVQAVDAGVTDEEDGDGDGDEEEGIDATDEDKEPIEDASDLIEDADDVIGVLNSADDADAVRE